MIESVFASAESEDATFNVLVVDDDQALRGVLAECLRSERHRVLAAEDGPRAVEVVAREAIDLVFLDVNMPGPNGISTLKQIKLASPDTTVVMMTGYGTIHDAIEAMKIGAEDFLLKPVSPENARSLADRVEQQKLPRKILPATSGDSNSDGPSTQLITRDPVMHKTLQLIKQIAPLPSTVLVEGESGTGKEVIARLIHEISPRAQRRFVAFNCAVIPEHLLESELFGHESGAFTDAKSRKIGYFEAAQGGTIFLDEIAEMSADLQVKLLRVIQERTFRRVGGIEEIRTDVRIIAATNRNLEEEAAAGRFRKDLFYRINVVKIAVPALRERPQDISLLGHYFIDKYATEFGKSVKGMSLQVLDRFLEYPWEGNVRELQNVIERAVAVTNADEITLGDLPDTFVRGDFPSFTRDDFKPYQAAKSDFEIEYLKTAMEMAEGNIARASRLAGISRQNLYEKLARYGIEQSNFRQGESGEIVA